MPPPPPAPRRPDVDHVAPAADVHDVPWRWWHAIMLFVVGFVAANVVGVLVLLPFGGVPEDGTAVGLPGLVASIVADVLFVSIMVLWLRSRTADPAAAVRFPRAGRLRDLRDGVGAGLVLYPVVAIGLGLLLTLVFQIFTGRIVRPPVQVARDLSTAGIVVAVIFGVVVAPVTEELFWRGILFRSLRRHGFWVAALGSAAGFGLVHYLGGPIASALLLVVAETGAGLGFAIVYERRGLLGSIGAHMAFNGVGLALILAVG